MRKDRCGRCEYGRLISTPDAGETAACMCLVIEGQRRPCPGGEACTAYRPAASKRRTWRAWLGRRGKA